MNTKTKFHKDGTLTVWNIYSQRRERRDAVSLVREPGRGNMLMPTLDDSERARITRMATRAEAAS